MRRHFLSSGLVALLLASVLAGAAWSQDEGSDPGQNKLHFPLNDEAGGLLITAQKALKAGEYERAIDVIRSVVDRDFDSPKRSNQLVAAEESPDPNAPRRLVGVVERANAMLRGLPAEARALYRKKFDRRAGQVFADALSGDDPVRDVLRAYERFPLATPAAEMLEKIADRSFTLCELDRARRLYERLLRDHRADLKNLPRVREKLLLACIPLGRKEQVESLLAAIAAEDKDARIHLNGAAKTRDEVLALTLKHEALSRGDAAESKPALALPRGDASNRAVFARPLKLGAARFAPKSFEESIDAFGERRGFRGGRDHFDGGPARYLPLIWNDVVFLATADKIRAFATDGSERPRIISLGQAYSDDNPNVQFGAAIEHGVLVAPFVHSVQDDQNFRGIPIKVKIPLRKLGGFDIERWRWRWNHATLLKDSRNDAVRRLDGASFPCAPVCQSGQGFVSAFAIEGFVHTYSVGFDVETGAVRWATWLASGQVEQTMFGEHAREPLCAPVALGDGQVFNATQMGCVAAVDADTGRVRWVTEYDQIEVRSAKGYYPDPRQIGWENNAPVHDVAAFRGSDGKVDKRPVLVAAPMDSDYFYGFDANTGERLWRFPRGANFEPNVDLRYVFGAAEGKVVLAGGKRILCVDLATGKRTWKVDLSGGKLVAGRGVLAGGKVYVPTSESIEVLTLERGTIETSQPVTVSGNLAVAGDTIVVTADGVLGAFQNLKLEKGQARGF